MSHDIVVIIGCMCPQSMLLAMLTIKKRVARVSISMHACNAVPIVMMLKQMIAYFQDFNTNLSPVNKTQGCPCNFQAKHQQHQCKKLNNRGKRPFLLYVNQDRVLELPWIKEQTPINSRLLQFSVCVILWFDLPPPYTSQKSSLASVWPLILPLLSVYFQ